MKRLALNGLLVAVSLAVSVAGVEYGTRFLFPALTPSGHLRFIEGEGDMSTLGPSNVQFRQIKNTGDFDVQVNFNKYGFRDSKDLATSSPQDYFLVGDSLSFGWGVKESERYSNLFQAALKRKVFNLCIPGDIDQFEKVLNYAEKNGAKVTNLLLAISMAFNLKDYEKNAEEKKEEKNQSPSLGIIAFLKPYLMTHSAFYFLVTSFVHKNEMLKNTAVDWGLIRPNLEGIAHHSFSEKIIDSTARRVARLANKYNTTIIIAPSRAVWFGTKEEKRTADRIHQTFVDRLKQLGLRFVDVRPTFEEEGDPMKNYFVNDGHWSPRGHASAARAIFRHMKEDPVSADGKT